MTTHTTASRPDSAQSSDGAFNVDELLHRPPDGYRLAAGEWDALVLDLDEVDDN